MIWLHNLLACCGVGWSTMIEFDYVVVGGGSSGCVVAGRLSEDPACQVALIEAGGSDTSQLIHVPAGMIGTVPTHYLNWAFATAPQANLNGRRGYQPRGCVLGGSSSINAMIYTRGHPSDYDGGIVRAGHGGMYCPGSNMLRITNVVQMNFTASAGRSILPI
jgi:choline dehydrogenase-like flavoprotein